MFTAHTESESFHAGYIGDDFPQATQDLIYPALVVGVEVGELNHIVTATIPGNGAQVGIVIYAEVLERAKVASVDGLRQPEFGGNHAAKVA